MSDPVKKSIKTGFKEKLKKLAIKAISAFLTSATVVTVIKNAVSSYIKNLVLRVETELIAEIELREVQTALILDEIKLLTGAIRTSFFVANFDERGVFVHAPIVRIANDREVSDINWLKHRVDRDNYYQNNIILPLMRNGETVVNYSNIPPQSILQDIYTEDIETTFYFLIVNNNSTLIRYVAIDFEQEFTETEQMRLFDRLDRKLNEIINLWDLF